MYTVGEMIADLQRLDSRRALVLVGCMWTSHDIKEYMAENFQDSDIERVTDEMIDELMIEVDSIDNFNNEDIENAIWNKFGNDSDKVYL
jgi:hypothetical protein